MCRISARRSWPLCCAFGGQLARLDWALLAMALKVDNWIAALQSEWNNSSSPSTSPPSSAKSFWQELVGEIASQAGISPELAIGVARQESGLNPGAMNAASGARGLMQLMPGTAAELGVDPNNVLSNIVGGVRYLRDQLSTFGDNAKALAAYNWGPGHVAEAVERWGTEWLSHAPRETQQYVTSILSRMGASTNSIITASLTPSHNSSPHVGQHPISGTRAATAAAVASVRSALTAYLLSEILD